MVIHLDTDNLWIIFSLERKDFIGGVGQKFIQELTVRLPDDNYITEKFMGKIVFMMDYYECFGIFVKLYKKYYPKEYKKQKVRVK